jgi:hypothetical protein
MEIHVEKTKLMRISRRPFLIHIMTDQKHLDNVEYFIYFGSMITNNARCKREIKSIFVMAKAAFNKKKNLLTNHVDLI